MVVTLRSQIVMEKRDLPSSPLDILSDVAVKKDGKRHSSLEMQRAPRHDRNLPAAMISSELSRNSSAPRPHPHDPYQYPQSAYGCPAPFYYYDPFGASHSVSCPEIQPGHVSYDGCQMSGFQPVPLMHYSQHTHSGLTSAQPPQPQLLPARLPQYERPPESQQQSPQTLGPQTLGPQTLGPQNPPHQHHQQSLASPFTPYAYHCSGYPQQLSPMPYYPYGHPQFPMMQSPVVSPSGSYPPLPPHLMYSAGSTSTPYPPAFSNLTHHIDPAAQDPSHRNMYVTKAQYPARPSHGHIPLSELRKGEAESGDLKAHGSISIEKEHSKGCRSGRRDSYTRFTPAEEALLVEGVQRYGVGNWKQILAAYPSFHWKRTPVDLKDKWRNLTRARQRRTASITVSAICGTEVHDQIKNDTSTVRSKDREKHGLRDAETGASRMKRPSDGFDHGEGNYGKCADNESTESSTDGKESGQDSSSQCKPSSDSNTGAGLSGSEPPESKAGSNNSSNVSLCHES